jgi:predicted RNA-binding Zn-ribbon protein involved in translation (DUF1610 family)
METIEVNKSDITEVIEYGFECPLCGEWIQAGNISDFDYCPECNKEIIIRK